MRLKAVRKSQMSRTTKSVPRKRLHARWESQGDFRCHEIGTSDPTSPIHVRGLAPPTRVDVWTVAITTLPNRKVRGPQRPTIIVVELMHRQRTVIDSIIGTTT